MRWKEESEKLLSAFVKLLIASKIFGKIILKPVLVISKRLELPWDDRTDANFIVPLRMCP